MDQEISYPGQLPITPRHRLAMPVQLDAALKPFKCRRSSCAAALGLTDGNELYVDGVIIMRTTLLICTQHECGHESQWRPQQIGTQVRRDIIRQKGVIGHFETCAIPVQRYPQLQPVNCYHCDKRVAYSDGSRFFVADVLIPHRVEYECLYCGERGHWRPILKPCPC